MNHEGVRVFEITYEDEKPTDDMVFQPNFRYLMVAASLMVEDRDKIKTVDRQKHIVRITKSLTRDKHIFAIDVAPRSAIAQHFITKSFATLIDTAAFTTVYYEDDTKWSPCLIALGVGFGNQICIHQARIGRTLLVSLDDLPPSGLKSYPLLPICSNPKCGITCMKRKVCAYCLTCCYCSVECQAANWGYHRRKFKCSKQNQKKKVQQMPLCVERDYSLPIDIFELD